MRRNGMRLHNLDRVRKLFAPSLTMLCVLALALTASADRKHDSRKLPSLRFVVYGDTRDGHDMHRKLVALIMKQKPEIVLQTGDLVNRGSKEDLWKTYDEITADMRKQV